MRQPAVREQLVDAVVSKPREPLGRSTTLRRYALGSVSVEFGRLRQAHDDCRPSRTRLHAGLTNPFPNAVAAGSESRA